jgi:signal transduction histidine kinase
MKISLQFRLLLSFLVVVLICVAIISLWANRSATSQFNLYLLRSSNLEEKVVKELTSYYEREGSWEDVEDLVFNLSSELGTNIFVLDKEGNLVARSGGKGMMGMMMSNSRSIEVDGEVVGRVSLRSRGMMGHHTPLEEKFILGVNRSLYLAVIVAFIVSFFLSFLLSRQIIVPVKELSKAAEKMSKGDLSQRVKVRSQDELGELAEAFNFMAQKLEENERTRRNMLSDIAHELRTPLTTIRGYLEGFREGVIPLEEEKIKELYEEVLFLSKLVDDLRELSLAEAGELKLNFQKVNFEKLIDEVFQAFSEKAKEKGVEMRAELQKPLPELEGDYRRLSQVLRNLISNSLAYTSSGEKIWVRAEKEGDELVVEVEDNGEGISPTDLPYIFERFYRAEKSRPHQEGKIGLGLAIAREIIQAHGGRIEAQSELGKGTLIRFTLPLRREVS